MSVEGYGSVFDVVDGGSDVVVKGAFTKSLSVRKPAMLWQHDTHAPIGVWDEVREDDRGLFVKGRFAETQLGREAHTLAKMGALTGLSIGYTVNRQANPVDPKSGVRTLKEVGLYEVSPVTFPMNEAARVTAVKSDELLYEITGALKQVLSGALTEREAETCLRDAGFSNRQAETLVASTKAYRKVLHGGSVSSDEACQLVDSIRRFGAVAGEQRHGTYRSQESA
jgi:HK97 family phage prohead protease